MRFSLLTLVLVTLTAGTAMSVYFLPEPWRCASTMSRVWTGHWPGVLESHLTPNGKNVAWINHDTSNAQFVQLWLYDIERQEFVLKESNSSRSCISADAHFIAHRPPGRPISVI